MSVEATLPLFVINLDRSADRLSRFMADNALPGLAITRFPAVDGSKLDRAQLVATKVITDDLIYSDNAVACSLSHLQCWQKVIDLGRAAVICEDDAVLRHDFVELHRRFETALDGADLIYWSYNFGLHMAYEQPGLGVVTVIPDNQYLDDEENVATFKANRTPTNLFRPRRLWGMACYSITPKGARKLLDLVLPLRNGQVDVVCRTGLALETVNRGWVSMCLDADLGLVHAREMDTWIAVPPVAVHRTDKSNVSTIDDGDETARFRRPEIDSNGNIRCFVPLESPSARALLDTALALQELKGFDRAVTYFDAAIRLAPKAAELHFNKGNALISLKRYEAAVASFDDAIALEPDHAAAFNNRGVALATIGRLEEAIASYDRTLALNPGLSEAKDNRDRLLTRMTSSPLSSPS